MGIDMTDLEMVKRCAEKMEYTYNAQHQQIGLPVWLDRESRNGSGILSGEYDPLHDDAQAMALGLSFPEQFEAAVCDWASMRRCGELNADLKRILCSFIARLP